MSEDEKKEKVLHARVSESLDEEIRARAAGLGISVSNLVRNVLGHAFGLVEDVIVDSAKVARSARGEGGRPASSEPGAASEPARPGKVVGWQRVLLEVNALCSECNAILARGTEAGLAVTDGPGPRPTLCTECLAARHAPTPEPPAKTENEAKPKAKAKTAKETPDAG